MSVHAPISGKGNFDKDVWELYHVDKDRAEAHNLAHKYPERLKKLIRTWFEEARKNKVLPLDDRSALEILGTERPSEEKPRDRYVYYPHTADVPESVAVNIRRRSYTIAAGATLDTPDAEGVLFAHGGVGGGHSLYVQGGRLHYVYNWLGERIQKISSDVQVGAGKHIFTAEFQKTGDKEGSGSATGTLTLSRGRLTDSSRCGTPDPGAVVRCGEWNGWARGSSASPSSTSSRHSWSPLAMLSSSSTRAEPATRAASWPASPTLR